MARALGTLILIGFVALGFAFVSGVGAGLGRLAAAPHVLWGLLAALFLLFVHSATMFYLIGRGRYVREVSRDLALGDGFVRQTREIKQMFFPSATWAILATIAASAAGGAASSRRGGPWVHLVLTLLAVVLNVLALWRGIVGIGRDLQIGAEIAQAEAPPGAEAAGG